MSGTKTSKFGTTARESHDSTEFYRLRMLLESGNVVQSHENVVQSHENVVQLSDWANKIYNKTSERMSDVPSSSVGLAFTSPPYNVGKEYDSNLSLGEYMNMIRSVAREVYRVLVPGGRYIVNVANLGRKPYIPLTAHFHLAHAGVGFLPMGEIIWQKAAGAGGNCAWGSWNSAKSPVLRDVHEYILVFSKARFGRPDKGESTVTAEEFMRSTLSMWDIKPESAKRIGHPAPFPLELASRVINLYSYAGDVVLDPFAGSGTTCLAAKNLGRGWVGYDISEEYCELANKRIEESK